MQYKGIGNSDSLSNPKTINERKSSACDSISSSKIDTNTNIKPHQHPFPNYQNQGEQNREPFGFDAR